MLKYVNTGVVFQEIPDEVTLSINISNCPCHCPGCHSQYLWDDIGNPLTTDSLDSLVRHYLPDITCVCFMGGDADPLCVDALAQFSRSRFPHLKIGWYSGKTTISPLINRAHFDYIKIGPFIRHLGNLKSPTTNQRLFRLSPPDPTLHDITSRFWKK